MKMNKVIAFRRFERADAVSRRTVQVFVCAARLLIVASLLTPLLLPSRSAARPRPAAEPPSPQEVTGVAEAERVDRAPKLDGTLNDPLWQHARPIDDFRQQEPLEGQPATERTEVRILYT